VDRHSRPPNAIAGVILNQLQNGGAHDIREFFATVFPEGTVIDALNVLVASIGLDDLGCHEQFGDAFEEVLVVVGLLANTVDVGAIREAAVLGGNAAGAEHRSHGAIPMAAVR
jgi:hypothetical protein